MFGEGKVFAEGSSQEAYLLREVVAALIEKESGGDDEAIGDRKLKYPAYGCLQIRQPCVEDINRHFGTNYVAKDCLGNRDLSVWIFHKYMEIYATEKRIGAKPTIADVARIWNGGPSRWRRQEDEDLEARLNGYFQSVLKILRGNREKEKLNS